MTIEEMKCRKKEKGYTYAQMAHLSGVPLGTIQKIFNGETESPRYDTLMALERMFADTNHTHQENSRDLVKEAMPYSVDRQGSYTIEDYRALPDEQRVELIDGYFYDMSAPTFLHQRIAGEIHRQIANYIMDHDGSCQPVMSPVDVQLDCDEKTMVQPDVAILCKEERIKKWGVYGSPDFILEVLSPSTRKKDCMKKLQKYERAGVREYWILDPYQKNLLVYFFESELCPVICGLDQSVPINIYEDKLEIQFTHILQWIENEAGE